RRGALRRRRAAAAGRARGRHASGDEDRGAAQVRVPCRRHPRASRRHAAHGARTLRLRRRPGVPDRRRSPRCRRRSGARRQADRQGRGGRQGDHRRHSRTRGREGAAALAGGRSRDGARAVRRRSLRPCRRREVRRRAARVAAMKAFRFERHGGPEVLRFEDVEIREPGAGELCIRNTAVAVNFRDVLVRRGTHAVKSFPSGLGMESAGVIEAIGPEVTGFAVGQRVVCVAPPDAAYAEERIIPARRAIVLPDWIADRTAASMMVRRMTARYLVKEPYRVKPGDTILIHAAAGGVGLIVCQWAKSLGATVIGTVSSAEKAALARAHGCDYPIGYEHFAEFVRANTDGEGVPAVYDSVGKATFEESLRCLARRGILASFGEASGDPDPLPPRRLGPLGSLYVTHPSLPDYTATRAELLTTANDLFNMVASGKVRIEISRTYPLAEAARAHADLEARRTTGSIVLTV